MNWENLREEEFAPMLKETHGVCAMAIGCLEKHGQHLPLGTDTLKGGRILELAAEREPVCVFPKLFLGDLQGARQKRPSEGDAYGYVALSAELLHQLLLEICDEIGRNGFTKILLFSSHGGNNSWIGNFLRAVTAKERSYEVFSFYNKLVMPKDILEVIAQEGREAFPQLTDSDIAVLEDFVAQGKFDGHGGFGETSMVLGTYPELVRLDKVEQESGMSTHRTDFLSEKGIQWGKGWHLNYPNAYAGHAAVGLTQAIADAAVEISVRRAAEVLKILKDDEKMSTIL